MPIANCIVSPHCPQGNGNIIDIWASAAKQSPGHMTVNFISSTAQFGRGYCVMANLLLPSMWSNENISSIQIALSAALVEYFNISAEQVHVTSTIVQSGMVVEAGHELSW